MFCIYNVNNFVRQTAVFVAKFQVVRGNRAIIYQHCHGCIFFKGIPLVDNSMPNAADEGMKRGLILLNASYFSRIFLAGQP